MDVIQISRELRRFIRKHRSSFDEIPRRQSALLELGALTIAAEHYRINDYTVQPAHLIGGRFKVKTSAKGYPFNFSFFHCFGNNKSFELHANLAVFSAQDDGGVYVVDVGVAAAGAIPSKKPRNKFVALDNAKLITFLEAKKLVVYPMLLAQFVGIVHEIKPRFINGRRPRGFLQDRHFAPSLVTTGYASGTSSKIIRGYQKRNIRLNVVTNFDTHLALLRGGKISSSPFPR